MVQVRQIRPIDKSIINVNQTTTSAGQTATTLKTTTFPCTVVGIRWHLTFNENAGSDNVTRWAIVVVRDGLAASTLASGTGSDLYTPEQDVLAWGVQVMTTAAGGVTGASIEGSTKTMRKLQAGDLLQLIAINSVANGCILDGAVQFFCKS